jgi:hypothetical protein
MGVAHHRVGGNEDRVAVRLAFGCIKPALRAPAAFEAAVSTAARPGEPPSSAKLPVLPARPARATGSGELALHASRTRCRRIAARTAAMLSPPRDRVPSRSACRAPRALRGSSARAWLFGIAGLLIETFERCMDQYRRVGAAYAGRTSCSGAATSPSPPWLGPRTGPFQAQTLVAGLAISPVGILPGLAGIGAAATL